MKISIIGMGHVGATIAHVLLMRGVGSELVLVNRTQAKAEGDAEDLTHANSIIGESITIRAGDLADTAGSDIVILTLSVPALQPGRRLLAEGNARLFRECVPQLAAASPGAVLVVVTNPVDPLTYLATRLSGFDPRRVLGAGTIIDSARFRAALSRHERIHPDDVRAYVLGEHGDDQFAATSVARIAGVPVPDRDAADRLFREAAASSEQVFANKGYTNFAIAHAAVLVVKSIVDNERRTMPVSTLVDGYLGVRDVCLSVPCVVGRGGVERVLAPALAQDETAAFRRSADSVRAVIEGII